MKAVFITFNVAYYDKIISVMDRMNLRGFTSWEDIKGRGSAKGDPHYGNHAWPTLNGAIMAMVDDEKVDPFLAILKEIDEKTPAQGLRAFSWNIEKTI